MPPPYLTLNALLGPRVRLSSELKGKLSVNPEELIETFNYGVGPEFLPALMVALGIVKPEDGIKLCEKFNDEGCVDFVLAVKGNSAAVKQLREWLINAFRELLFKNLDLLKELGADVDTNKLFNEFMELVNGLDGKFLAQLLAPVYSMAQLALMLHALVNGDGKLARAHSLMGATYSSKLLSRLSLEAYRACCDLKNESFRRAIAKRFFYHV